MSGLTCASCGNENPAAARFCMSCGTALAHRCPSCGTEAPPEARFCMSCGIELPGAPPAPAATPPVPASGDIAKGDERRQVTVLFADLSGYTAVAERMDPEAVKDLVGRCLRRLGEEVERHGGSVDKYIGDNVMALFGAPVAHEDDAERAVRAALGMQAAMEEINRDFGAEYGASFQLRVGVNTGEVLYGVVGDSFTVTGDTVNVASRLQAAAQPGTVTVGERTHRASRDAISYRPLEPLALKGKAEPVPAWEAETVVAATPAGRVLPGTETPLIGRETELALLGSLYDRVERERRPHLVTVLGQAGVGKSRLLRELAARLDEADNPPKFRQGRCLPYGSSIVYWALGEVLRAECEIYDTDPSDVAWEKLHDHVGALLREKGQEGEESIERRIALIGRLLGIEPPDSEPVDHGDQDPQKVREASFSAIRACLEAIARRQPMILALEDIHWADQGMLDLIEYLAQWVRAPLLLVCLARDELLESRPSWGGGRRAAISIPLEPLSADHTRELISALLPGADGELLPEIAERAGGNPFFAEEMARRVAEEGAEDAGALPDTVQGLLAARLDSLDAFERRLVQRAAVVGRTFWADALAPVAAGEGQDLDVAVAALQEKEIFVVGEGGGGTVDAAGHPELAFKHVLIRDVAYGMLPKAVRARTHYEVGAFIEGRAGDRTDEVVALLAEHYSRAAALGGEARLAGEELDPIRDKALHFLEAAGDGAANFYSNLEAFSHYRAAMDLGAEDPVALARIGEKAGDVALRLGRVDAAIEVWEQCLDYHRGQEDLERVAALHRKIGAALAHKGERRSAIEHHQKGINLLKDGAPSIELVRLYEEAAWLYMQTGENMLAIYASERALRLAERLGETRAASRAHGIFGRVFSRIGDTAKARDNLERAVELARGSDWDETILALLALGHHLEVSEADYAGANEAYSEALSLAERVGDVPAQVELHAALAQLAVYRADWDGVAESAQISADLAEREGLVAKLCLPQLLRALLLWREAEWDDAESLYRSAHELAVQVGWSEVAFSALYGLAATLRDRGDYDGAIEALAHATDVCERAGLIAQAIQAGAARAVALALAGRTEQAVDAAEEASDRAAPLHYPVGEAAALEGEGIAAGGREGHDQLREAADRWQALGRPLDAARCRLWAARAIIDTDHPEAVEELQAAEAAFEGLGVTHLAARAGELAQAR